jgi:hypothetical protein
MKFLAYSDEEHCALGDTVSRAVENYCEYFGEDLTPSLLADLKISELGNEIECKLESKVVVKPTAKFKFPKTLPKEST